MNANFIKINLINILKSPLIKMYVLIMGCFFINSSFSQTYLNLDSNYIKTSLDSAVGLTKGSNKQILFGANSNYVLDSLYINNEYNSQLTRDSNKSYTFYNIQGTQVLTLIYSYQTYKINLLWNNGGVINYEGDSVILKGSSKRYFFEPKDGYVVDSVWIDGKVSDSLHSYTFNLIDINHTIVVKFKIVYIKVFTITASAGEGGIISPNGIIEVDSNSNKLFAIASQNGYEIDSLIVNGLKINSVNFYTFNNVVSNQTIRVVFKKIQVVLCLTPSIAPNIVRVGANLTSSITNYNKYIWSLNGIVTDSFTISSYTPPSIGVYTLFGRDSNGCASNISKKYYYSPNCIITTGRIGNGASIHSSLIDNPNQILIKWCPEIMNQNLIIKVVNTQGVLIFEQNIDAKLGTFMFDKNNIIDKSYFIHIYTKGGELVQISDIVNNK